MNQDTVIPDRISIIQTRPIDDLGIQANTTHFYKQIDTWQQTNNICHALTKHAIPKRNTPCKVDVNAIIPKIPTDFGPPTG